MKSLLRQLTTLSAIAATTCSAAIALPLQVSAAQFGQQPIADDRIVAVAEPVNNGRFYNLLIIEQLSSARRCWQEQGNNPTIVNPLLLTFDFSGICGRSSDSNGYSVRVNGEDLGSRYRLRVEQQGDSLVLVASPSPLQRGLPKLELGRSTGVVNDFVKLELDAGWTLTRRVFNGQTLGHIYLTNNQPLDTVIAASGARQPTSPRPPISSPTPRPLPTPPSGNPLPRPGSPPRNNDNIDYQVIVPGGSALLRSRVNSVEPGAFRTTVNGQSVIQAGRFREQSRANELRQRLVQAGLSAQIVEVAQVNSPTTPTPSTPSANVIYQVIVPGGSALLRSRVNSVEPGAFRTTVNGQSVIQAGRFREQPRANQLQTRLQNAGLDARIVQTTGTAASPPSSPSPRLPTPAARQGEVLIMIDPGHGGRDPGAVGRNGLLEKEINIFIARRLQSTLEQRGYRAALTRTQDVEVDLQPRVDIAERANATIFVSIHANAISLSRPEVNGLETYYFSTGRNLARAIHSSVLRSTDLRDRGVRQARFYVLRNTSMPAVLVETGFVTGREDATRFQSTAAREQIADAIAQGIIDYLR
ncbi:n-acetylmuramoyl-l-alanine amidase [Leptolyngbya sp. Heron Island J]|uniref:DUF3747 domain-containing protein n=1 Tax=Leptolyngbya sp. Heron Island J TaxID=1385935 RepID=UPI0003B94EBF|nr:DUF3747 domain-containing protein [Leptolyngbya sp. Heron Island J]ESA38077.1 n-acetylmuramoyl-l-alanine amidase [Leptolyngbya sp. Heron Island J]